MKCSSCGAEINDSSTFCDNCGTVVTNAQVGNGLGIKHETFKGSSEKNGSLKLNWIIIALIAVIVMLVCVLISIIVVNNQKNLYDNYNSVNENAVSETNQTTERTAATEAPINTRQTPVFTKAASSSIRGTDTEGGQYSTDAVLNTNNETKWVPQKNSNGGISEWVEIYSDDIQYIRGIEILNGYHKSYEIWKNNNRVKFCTITFSNGESRNFVLDDTMDLIRLDLGGIVETSSIKLTINSIYAGVKWNDTAITYLGAY